MVRLRTTEYRGKVKVGVIAIENEEYDPKRWWVSSEGVRTVINETIAYVYALVIFPFV